MIKNIFSSQAKVTFCLIAIFFIPLFSLNIPNSEEETWMMISSYLDCFLNDPVTNLPLLERIDDLYYWTLIYNKIKEKSVLCELFSKQFQVSEIDELKLDVIFCLLKAYSYPSSYQIPKPIISRIIEISSIKPDWFARNLLIRDDRRELIRLIVRADIEYILGQRKGLKEILSGLGDHELKKELMELLNELDEEEQKEFARLDEFMKDPAGNLDEIKDIYNLCSIMGRYDDLYVDENKTLWPKNNSVLILQEWIKDDTDEKKIKVLFYIMNHCDSAYHSEVINSIAFELLLKRQPLFVTVMKDNQRWRMIMLRLIYDIYSWERHFNRTINIPGNSDFEVKIRSQLEFLRKHLKYDN